MRQWWWQPAGCGKEMSAGRHYVELTPLSVGAYGIWAGVMGRDVNPRGPDEVFHAITTCKVCMLRATGGHLMQRRDSRERDAGQEGLGGSVPQGGHVCAREGDKIGLLLHVERRTLSVYLNGKRCALMTLAMASPCPEDAQLQRQLPEQYKQKDGSCGQTKAVTVLGGPLRWCVDLSFGASVRIESKALPAGLSEDCITSPM
jgi:hypothetical protein